MQCLKVHWWRLPLLQAPRYAELIYWSFHVVALLRQYGLFLAEVTAVVIAIGVVIRFLFNAIRHAREYTAEHLDVKNLNRRFEQMADVLNHDLLNPHERKAHIKAKKKEYKLRTKEQKKGKTVRSRV